MPEAFFSDLKTLDYKACLELQHAVHGARVRGMLPDTLLLVEHPHVLTFGRRAREENVLVSKSILAQKGISRVHVERGGDVTYHGPGQLVAYPIFGLPKSMGVIDFVEKLEAVMIQVLKDYGVRGERDSRNRGVWVKNRKIGFVGIAVQRGVSFHGLALNISPALTYFQMIHPCGLKQVEITALGELIDPPVSMNLIKNRLLSHFEAVFGMALEKLEPNDLRARLKEITDDQ